MATFEVERRSGKDRRYRPERRKFDDPVYSGPERRSGIERRNDKDRRKPPPGNSIWL